MPKLLPYSRECFLNSGPYKPCAGVTVREIIEYLQQFPPEWRIDIGRPVDENGFEMLNDYFGKSEPVLLDTGICTRFVSIGETLYP